MTAGGGLDGSALRGALLLVDDDEANLLTLGALLEDEGFEVDTAASCAAARESLSVERVYVAVLLDGTLGDGAGLDLVPVVRASQPDASIILVSGCVHVVPDGSPVDAVMAKGGAFEDLLAMLNRLLAR